MDETDFKRREKDNRHISEWLTQHFDSSKVAQLGMESFSSIGIDTITDTDATAYDFKNFPVRTSSFPSLNDAGLDLDIGENFRYAVNLSHKILNSENVCPVKKNAKGSFIKKEYLPGAQIEYSSAKNMLMQSNRVAATEQCNQQNSKGFKSIVNNIFSKINKVEYPKTSDICSNSYMSRKHIECNSDTKSADCFLTITNGLAAHSCKRRKSNNTDGVLLYQKEDDSAYLNLEKLDKNASPKRKSLKVMQRVKNEEMEVDSSCTISNSEVSDDIVTSVPAWRKNSKFYSELMEKKEQILLKSKLLGQACEGTAYDQSIDANVTVATEKDADISLNRPFIDSSDVSMFGPSYCENNNETFICNPPNICHCDETNKKDEVNVLVKGETGPLTPDCNVSANNERRISALTDTLDDYCIDNFESVPSFMEMSSADISQLNTGCYKNIDQEHLDDTVSLPDLDSAEPFPDFVIPRRRSSSISDLSKYQRYNNSLVLSGTNNYVEEVRKCFKHFYIGDGMLNTSSNQESMMDFDSTIPSRYYLNDTLTRLKQSKDDFETMFPSRSYLNDACMRMQQNQVGIMEFVNDKSFTPLRKDLDFSRTYKNYLKVAGNSTLFETSQLFDEPLSEMDLTNVTNISIGSQLSGTSIQSDFGEPPMKCSSTPKRNSTRKSVRFTVHSTPRGSYQ